MRSIVQINDEYLGHISLGLPWFLKNTHKVLMDLILFYIYLIKKFINRNSQTLSTY